jgi:bifunctional non-homologous end joining protein LigD
MRIGTINNSNLFQGSRQDQTEERYIKKNISAKRIFVVQRHLGSVLHYDFRIQVNGVLKSWALPSGPSMNADDRRLAIAIEDKPLDFATLKGVRNSKVNGTVEFWDKGIFISHSFYSSGDDDKELVQRIHEGRLSFTLKGKKLQGVFSLIRLNNSEHWVMLKGNDKYAVDFQYRAEDLVDAKSVINGILKSGGLKTP